MPPAPAPSGSSGDGRGLAGVAIPAARAAPGALVTRGAGPPQGTPGEPLELGGEGDAGERVGTHGSSPPAASHAAMAASVSPTGAGAGGDWA